MVLVNAAQNEGVAVSHGCGAAIAGVLHAHNSNAAVIEAACSVIRSIGYNPGMANDNEPLVVSMLHCIAEMTEHSSALDAVLGALRNLLFHEPNKKAAISNGAANVLIRCISETVEAVNLQKSCISAFRMIAGEGES